jgi:soluble lytic murein transglycosylase-like protein
MAIRVGKLSPRVGRLWGPLPERLPAIPRSIAGFGLGIVVGAALVGWRLAPAAATSAAPAVSFVGYGAAVTVAATPLLAAPAGSEVLAEVPAGARLGVGGKVGWQAGLARQDAYWVSYTAGAGDPESYGFVPVRAVQLLAGEPPPLSLAGIPWSALLRPEAGVSAASAAVAPATRPVAESAVQAAAAPGAAASAAALAIPWLPDTVRAWEPLFLEAASRHDVDPALLAIVTLVESGGNPRARSGSGAIGLMQVMPTTGQDIARQRALAGFAPEQLYDPATNVDFGAWYLSAQLRRFGRADDPDWLESVDRAAAAYNGGPGSVERWLAGGRLPAEAERYRGYVRGLWSERAGAGSATLDRWLAAGGARLVEAARAAGVGLGG